LEALRPRARVRNGSDDVAYRYVPNAGGAPGLGASPNAGYATLIFVFSAMATHPPACPLPVVARTIERRPDGRAEGTWAPSADAKVPPVGRRGCHSADGDSPAGWKYRVVAWFVTR
jgi:hypothetical protein